MASLIGYLGGESSSLALAATLWLVGLIAIALLIVRTVNRRRQIRSALDYVEMSRDAAEFARKFKSISPHVEASRLLGTWRSRDRTYRNSVMPGLGSAGELSGPGLSSAAAGRA